MSEVSPFHPGEQQVQKRLGVFDKVDPWARKFVRSWMPDQHREFYAQLPFLVATARDEQQRPWVTLLTGEPGFVQSPTDTELRLNAQPLAGDALENAFFPGVDLGLLGIELDSRRRNRVNGSVIAADDKQLKFRVSQSFGNCPQYITERLWYQVDTTPRGCTNSTVLTESMQQWIQRSDTFFIGSGYRGNTSKAGNGLDASHRGGPKGFVEVKSPTRLVFPDYSGNNFFNTIGNLSMDSRVGLLFMDFGNGSLLQITGHATIDWDSPEVARHAGAQRLVAIDVDAVVELKNSLPLRFSLPHEETLELVVFNKVKESTDVTSFYFKTSDGSELPDFQAGQHLPLEFDIESLPQPVSRTYSLSIGPGQGCYRISVKREDQGLVSRHMHDTIEVGARLTARPPAGNFVVEQNDRPVVLLSAGVGVTPMLSMLSGLTQSPSQRPIFFIHGAKDGEHHPLAEEVQGIAKMHSNVTIRVAYSNPLPSDQLHTDYDHQGRINQTLLRETIPNPDADYYLCGPPQFLSSITDELLTLGVQTSQINVEQF
ncbi:MAG: pyridoxamine 5'-phosphate oxidase family protein [Pseudomonadota bacterium]